jgi:hypothetical protein
VNRARPGQVIGYRTNGCPIRSIGGGAPDDDSDDGGDLGDLIDDAANGGGDDTGSGDDGGNDGGSGSAPPAWWGPAAQTLQTTIQTQVNSEIDRRINQLQNSRRSGNNQGSQSGQQGSGHQQDPPQTRHTVGGGIDPGDIRDARAVAREAISDSGVRLTPEERELLGDYLAGAIVVGLTRDSDPDVVGNHVATQYIAKVKKLRGSYQKRIVNRLSTQGVLDKEKLKPGQRQGGGSQQGQQEGKAWETGAAKAQELLQRRGALPQQQTSSKN